MKKALVIANMMFASASVWGMNVSSVNQENNRNVFVETKDLSEREKNTREHIIELIDKFHKIDCFEATKNALIDRNILEFLMLYKNQRPLTNQQFKNLIINPQILNYVDQNGNTLLSYTIKTFTKTVYVGCEDERDMSRSREKLLELCIFMLEYGADPFLKMSDEKGSLMEYVKERKNEDWYKGEAKAAEKLLDTYEKLTTNTEEHH